MQSYSIVVLITRDVVWPVVLEGLKKPSFRIMKVMFLHLSVSHSVHRRSTWAGTPWDQMPPGPGTPPGRYTPLDQVHPPGLGTPPLGRYDPLRQVHPSGRYTPRAGTHPGTRYTPPDRYTPLGQVHPRAGTPPGQVHPLGPGTPPRADGC